MYQFFVEDENIGPEQIRITGADVNHIGNVLRMKPGERIRISAQSGKAFLCHVESITPEEVVAAIDERDVQTTEFAHRVYLFQGLPKQDKMELIVQKAVELGVYEVIPVTMKNCVVKLDDKKAESKVKRWQAIAESAAKQSKRTIIPKVHRPLGFLQALELAGGLDITLVPYENARSLAATRERIRSIPENVSIGVMIGPEGGFAAEEIEAVRNAAHTHCISLGRRMLRTETAGLATLSMLVYELDT